MKVREIPDLGHKNVTRNKILDEATKLFALKGFDALSMRDIAKAVEIKTSSIYYYYESKDTLLEDILLRFERGYRHYFDWLSSENSKADSLEKLMENMFNKEFLEMLNPIGCLGMSLVLKEQHNNEAARRRAFEIFYEYSINNMQADFDGLIEKGVIPSADTKIIATLFMFCVLVGNDIRLHEFADVKPPIDCTEMYNSLRRFLTAALMQKDMNRS